MGVVFFQRLELYHRVWCLFAVLLFTRLDQNLDAVRQPIVPRLIWNRNDVRSHLQPCEQIVTAQIASTPSPEERKNIGVRKIDGVRRSGKSREHVNTLQIRK